MRSIIPPGGADQREWPDLVASRGDGAPLADRQDVLVFQTAPLRRDVSLVGSAEARLWVSSAAVDTDITVKLIDVYPSNSDYPEGYALNLIDSILRLRFREGWTEERLLDPGAIYSVTILLPPTANRFAAGHRIRVDVSSSNFPRFDANPNTGEPIGRHTRLEVATNALHVGRTTPSNIVLPVIPAMSDKPASRVAADDSGRRAEE
jgi:putative CocE/NonD family hydrolase